MSGSSKRSLQRNVLVWSATLSFGCAGAQEQESPSRWQARLNPTFVQVNSSTPQTAQSRVTQTYALAQGAGNLNVAVVGWRDTTAQLTSVTDSKGNAYRLAIGPTRQRNRLSQSIYYASNIAAAAAQSNTVSVTFSAPANFVDLRILEYAGLDPNSPFDQAVGASGISATSNSGRLNTTNANDLLIAGNVVSAGTASAGPNFTSRILTNPNGDIAEDRSVSHVGAYTASARLTGSGAWVMQMAAFKAGSGGSGGSAGTGGASATGGLPATGGNRATGGATATGGASSGPSPAGWLYTSGNKIYLSNGNGSGTSWVGRGVNVDDIFFCGYNAGLWMSDPQGTFTTMIDGLMSDWKPTFLRLSLGMKTYDTVSWTANSAQYRTPMENVINHIGSFANTYALVVLRTDSSMGAVNASDDATYYPTSATDPTYVALVDTFAKSNFVMFGVANEPGGNTLSNAQLRNAMVHAVGTIRAEEDRLGVPHHLVAVQGNSWTSDISYYAANPLSYDNVVYEVHGYPPATRDYTYAGLPVIIGEYGPSSSDTSFFSGLTADFESKQISSLAWDFEPFSNCSPDLLNITGSATSLQPNSWGNLVQNYLLAHAR